MRTIRLAILSMFLASGPAFASENTETVTYSVENMTCATCPIVVRKAMQRVLGVKVVQVSLETASEIVTFDPSMTTAKEIGQASTDVGFPAILRDRQ